MSRKANDRYGKEDALPSDGSENDRESVDDEEVRTARPARGGNIKAPASIAQKTQQLYCVCKRPYSDTEFMICCDGCENWFHGRCVGVTESMAQSIENYYCPDCQQNRGYEEEEPEPQPLPPPKEEKKVVVVVEVKPPVLRSPVSAPTTPVEHKAVPIPALPAPHSVTPPSGASRHKRKGLAMRAISKLTTVLPPPALPAPEILAREAAKFKTEPTHFTASASSASHSLLDFSKSVQSSSSEKKTPSAAASQLEGSKGRDTRGGGDAHSDDSPESSAHPDAGAAGTVERPSPDASEDFQAQKRRGLVVEPAEEAKAELNADLAAAAASARSDEQGRRPPKKGRGVSPKNPRRADEEAAPADAKSKPPPAPTTNGPAATHTTPPAPPAAPTAAPTSQTPSSAPAPATVAPGPSSAQILPPPPSVAAPSQPSSASLPNAAASISPSPDMERKGNARYSKRKGKKGEEDGAAKPPGPVADVKAELESHSEASLSQSQPAEVEPKRAKPRAKNAAVNKEPPAPDPTPAAASTDDVIAPRRAKLAAYFPQDYNQRSGKPSPQPAAGAPEMKDDKSSEDESKEKSPKRKPGKRKGAQTADTPAEGEHLAPRRAKLAAYFPEDYKGEKEEGGAPSAPGPGGEGDEGQEERQKYCICKRAYDNRSFMISCTRCKDWFHGTCIGIALQEAKRIKNFVCPRCEKRASDK